MKKNTIAALIILTVFLAASCGSPPRPAAVQPAVPAPVQAQRPVNGVVPDFVRDAMRNAPEDGLVAIGTATLTNLALALSTAEARAMAGIARQVDVVVSNMVRDAVFASEADLQAGAAFQMMVTEVLARERLRGATVTEIDAFPQGIAHQAWAVVVLPRAGAADNIRAAAAESAARLGIQANVAQWGFDLMEGRMDAMDMAVGENNRNPLDIVASDD